MFLGPKLREHISTCAYSNVIWDPFLHLQVISASLENEVLTIINDQQINQTIGAVGDDLILYFKRLSNSYQLMKNNLIPTDSPVTDKIHHHLSAGNPSRSYQPMESIMAEPLMPYLSNCQQPTSNHDSHTALQWPTSSLYQEMIHDLSKRLNVNRLRQMKGNINIDLLVRR